MAERRIIPPGQPLSQIAASRTLLVTAAAAANGDAWPERMCGSSAGAYCCTLLLYLRFEHSNFASDLWS